tara:strand:- start:2178 stop:3110 length:933 start_codon:yes stop_codon:yes gene_type:complete
MVYFCYIDESGTPEMTGNTSHFVLAGLAIPISKWKYCENGISQIKNKYCLNDAEIHTAWIARKYLEQSRIVDFEKLNHSQRVYEVSKYRKKEMLALQKNPTKKTKYKQVKKNFQKTHPYIHLTFDERISFLQELADFIGSWSFARIFCEAIDKIHFDPARTKQTVDEQALEQIVSRFEIFMSTNKRKKKLKEMFGTLVHDNNETVSKKHTALMQKFHAKGTFFTKIKYIIETPFFVNSELTSLVQIADLCSFSIRRYLENGETDFFSRIEPRIGRVNGKVVSARHFTDNLCKCEICSISSIKVISETIKS